MVKGLRKMLRCCLPGLKTGRVRVICVIGALFSSSTSIVTVAPVGRVRSKTAVVLSSSPIRKVTIVRDRTENIDEYRRLLTQLTTILCKDCEYYT